MWRLLDNTVLSNFAAAKRPDIVLQLWPDQSCTTPGVLLEYQNAVLMRNYPPYGWAKLPVLELTEVEHKYKLSLPTPLGPGECECIAVAVHRQGSFVSDDGHARAIARARGIELSGTLGILLTSSDLGIVTFAEANTLLKKMIAAGYHSPVDDLGKL
jgi:predicted nucleic acid-binding protein